MLDLEQSELSVILPKHLVLFLSLWVLSRSHRIDLGCAAARVSVCTSRGYNHDPL